MGTTRSTLLQNAVLATGNGESLDLQGAAIVHVQTLIAGTATVTFEISLDNTNWTSLGMISKVDGSTVSTTSTASNSYFADVRGVLFFRARVSSWSSGAVTVLGSAYTAE